jgi:hypothetical protein
MFKPKNLPAAAMKLGFENELDLQNAIDAGSISEKDFVPNMTPAEKAAVRKVILDHTQVEKDTETYLSDAEFDEAWPEWSAGEKREKDAVDKLNVSIKRKLHAAGYTQLKFRGSSVIGSFNLDSVADKLNAGEQAELAECLEKMEPEEEKKTDVGKLLRDNIVTGSKDLIPTGGKINLEQKMALEFAALPPPAALKESDLTEDDSAWMTNRERLKVRLVHNTSCLYKARIFDRQQEGQGSCDIARSQIFNFTDAYLQQVAYRQAVTECKIILDDQKAYSGSMLVAVKNATFSKTAVEVCAPFVSASYEADKKTSTETQRKQEIMIDHIFGRQIFAEFHLQKAGLALPPWDHVFEAKCAEVARKIGDPGLAVLLNDMHDEFGDIWCTSGKLGIRTTKHVATTKTSAGETEEKEESQGGGMELKTSSGGGGGGHKSGEGNRDESQNGVSDMNAHSQQLGSEKSWALAEIDAVMEVADLIRMCVLELMVAHGHDAADIAINLPKLQLAQRRVRDLRRIRLLTRQATREAKAQQHQAVVKAERARGIEWKKGAPLGTCRYASGAGYEGEWKDVKKHGHRT